MAAEPIVEPILEPLTAPILTLVPEAIPTEGEPTIFAGPSRVPSWDDVYNVAKSFVSNFQRGPYVDPHVTQDQLTEGINAAIGSTIKVLSGFINTLANAVNTLQEWTSMELDALSANVGAIYSYFEHRINVEHATNAAITELAIPNLQAQINQLHLDILHAAQFNSAADRAWATDNIFAPLYEGLIAESHATDAKISAERANRIADVDQHANILQGTINALGATVLPQLANLIQESEDCVQPMCETMGPKTDLGKLLKLIKWASLAALLVELEGYTADDINRLFGQFGHWLTESMTVVDDLFVGGGETIGHAVLDAVKRIG